MSQGARNCPFLTLTTLPVAAAASSRSVCRHRKAGICSTSTACATSAHCDGLMHVGQHGQSERGTDLGEDRQRLRKPDAARGRAAGAVGLVERGLVDEPDLRAGPRSPSARDATSSAWLRLSSWHGPAMIEIGKWLPNLTEPAVTTGCRRCSRSRDFPFLSADHAGPRHQDQPCLTPEYQGCTPGYFTDENAVGTSNWLTMLSMIWPSSSLLARPAIQSGSA